MGKNLCKKIAFLLITVMSMNTIAFAETKPEITAKTGILMEATTGKIIYNKGMHEKMYPASMTKIVTAMVALDNFSPDATIVVGKEINGISLDSSKAGHILGETLTVENLIRGLMIPSGNDSANVLAAAVAKKTEKNENMTDEEWQKVFSDLMNKKAEEIGAKETHFTNAHGYHDENHYTTAYDMALFTREALKNDTIKKIAAEKTFTGNGAGNTLEADSKIVTQEYQWKSHNLLIKDNQYKFPSAIGVKTGFTDQAGACLAAAAEKDGTTFIAVVMFSKDPDRWQDATKLFQYAYDNYAVTSLLKADKKAKTVLLKAQNRLDGDTLDLVVKKDVTSFLKKGEAENLEKSISYEKKYLVEGKDGDEIRLKAPIKKDAKVGTISYSLDGKVLKKADLLASRDVAKWSIGSSIKYFFKNLFSNLFSLKTVIVIAIILLILLIIFFIKRMMGGRRRNQGYKFRKNKRRGGFY